ncbi:N-acetyl-gamma-glutamyl-phosphate reductase [Enterovirga sp.]|jgi:N-acetyl-gamma-glutamyl-phosphate reductase|uniref:N-acetyl-gamma-glutamyl-phosphate reductase n=1 Tax=Enterovirga sp. TaxID=2026350 RepID=UPI002624DEC6|nr:N-acetyl-gamma-glutamyl-phosphate reductase [Enterovirga sp.]MDB5591663.1 N-acetyl-gamma-glutamyl-phosphate reductase [Enterovirga sp.]
MDKSADPTQPKSALPAVFIDGEAGTTGLEIRERLAARQDLQIRSIAAEHRKDPAARQALMAESDLVILCLPDAAAREAVALAAALGSDAPRIVDASTAHRTAPEWVYGFAELAPGQRDAIRQADRVSNPGCYSTGAIALLRPLVDAGLLPADHPISVNAVSGYSGGGRTMIEDHESGRSPAFELYGLGFEHKHLPETMLHGRLTARPIFIPSVGSFRQGMLVSVPLHLDRIPGRPSAGDLEAALRAHYAAPGQVSVVAARPDERLEPEALNGSDLMELRVYGRGEQALLVARLDNLGKGASGAAVQNAEIMLGLSGTSAS